MTTETTHPVLAREALRVGPAARSENEFLALLERAGLLVGSLGAARPAAGRTPTLTSGIAVIRTAACLLTSCVPGRYRGRAGRALSARAHRPGSGAG
jgi:hypothetical protein